MNYTSTGEIKFIGKTVQVTDNFSKREFVILTDDTYPQTVLFQLLNTHCTKIDAFKVGDTCIVTFSIAGRVWKKPDTGEERYFNSMNAFKLDLISSKPATPKEKPSDDLMSDDLSKKGTINSGYTPSDGNNDDLPF